MRELHLFAGAGGGILGGMMLGHELPPFPICEDVRKFDGHAWRGLVDVICGGFPCQPFSCAGKQLGTADPRHLWPEMARIIEEVRPRYVFAENVTLGAFEEPWRDLRRLGYRVPPAICVSASDVGAPHLRKRWWLLAHAEGQPKRAGLCEGQQTGIGRRRSGDSSGEAPSHANGTRLEEREGISSNTREELAPTIGADWWSTEPNVGRVAHGVASRVDRLKAIGNGQVPLTAATAWRLLMEAHA
jgi:DNA (cytosine-5)-methyltransferase 1